MHSRSTEITKLRAAWPDARILRTPLAEVPPAVLADYMDSAPEEVSYAYELVGYGRHAEVELTWDDLFRVTCWGEGQTTVTWRATADDAFEVARAWAHNGELPKPVPTLQGLGPVLMDEHAPGLQRARLMRGVHGDATLGELEASRG